MARDYREGEQTPEERYYQMQEDSASEKPWWETLLLYGAIAAIALVVFGVVFVRPQLSAIPTGAVVQAPVTTAAGSTESFLSTYKWYIGAVVIIGGLIYSFHNKEQERQSRIPKIISMDEGQELAIEALKADKIDNLILLPFKRNRKDLMVYRFLFAEELIEGFNFHHPTGYKKRDRYFYKVAIDYYGKQDLLERADNEFLAYKWIHEKADPSEKASLERWRRLTERNLQGSSERFDDYLKRERLMQDQPLGNEGIYNSPRYKRPYQRRRRQQSRHVMYGNEVE